MSIGSRDAISQILISKGVLRFADIQHASRLDYSNAYDIVLDADILKRMDMFWCGGENCNNCT